MNLSLSSFVMSTSIHHCVNNISHIKVLKKVIPNETFNVSFFHHNKFT